MNFDLAQVPFSRFGSYTALSHLSAHGARPEGLYLRSVRGAVPGPEHMQIAFRLQPLAGDNPVAYRAIASATHLRLETETGFVELCLPDADRVLVRGQGAGLRLTATPGRFDHAFPRAGGRWQVTLQTLQEKYMLSTVQGRLAVEAPWQVDASTAIRFDLLPDPQTGIVDCAIDEFVATWLETPVQPFERALAEIDAEFGAWLMRTPEVPDAYAATRELAAYITWSCVVAPEGLLTRPAMLMSKNWMASLWSWDNCFNALALAYCQPGLAWDQFMLPFEHQDAQGGLPDFINDRLIFRTFCKPPVQGWTLRRMMAQGGGLDRARLQEAYEPLGRWTHWWLEQRDDDRDGVPQYNHGNDSGWDNSTAFALLPPFESPDLSAYLVLQMDTLAQIAHRLGKPGEAAGWKSRADALLAGLIRHSWRGDHFVAPRSGDHSVRKSDSLLLFVPLLLGERLPETLRSSLLAGLTRPGRFITPHGLASESVASPDYIPDGYWRGPIWGASTLLLTDGLAACGQPELARRLSTSFCDLAARSGLAENYDALSGAGLRDRAFTWTASIFLILAHELSRPASEPKPQ